jgi:hypothetical protein
MEQPIDCCRDPLLKVAIESEVTKVESDWAANIWGKPSVHFLVSTGTMDTPVDQMASKLKNHGTH